MPQIVVIERGLMEGDGNIESKNCISRNEFLQLGPNGGAPEVRPQVVHSSQNPWYVTTVSRPTGAVEGGAE
jgi:hypothetical protein